MAHGTFFKNQHGTWLPWHGMDFWPCRRLCGTEYATQFSLENCLSKVLKDKSKFGNKTSDYYKNIFLHFELDNIYFWIYSIYMLVLKCSRMFYNILECIHRFLELFDIVGLFLFQFFLFFLLIIKVRLLWFIPTSGLFFEENFNIFGGILVVSFRLDFRLIWARRGGEFCANLRLTTGGDGGCICLGGL